ncbi:hypothetical protein MASR2M39_12210 [Ignavibacteriales bacterium]
MPEYILYLLLGMIIIVLINLAVTFILLKKYSENKVTDIDPQDRKYSESEGQKNELIFTQKVEGRNILDKKLEELVKPITDLLTELKISQYYDFEGNVTWNFYLQKKMNEVLEKFEVLKRSVDSQDVTVKEIVHNLKKIQAPVPVHQTPSATDNNSQNDSSRPQSTGRKF